MLRAARPDPTFAASAIEAPPMARAEQLAVALLLALSFGLRIAAGFTLRLDSDETQHMHVAWQWSRGKIAYRDFFDNHAPLFHWLAVPLVRIVGERPEIMLWGRIGMTVLIAALLALLFRLAHGLFGPRVAAWSLVVAALWPPFLEKSIEFRADVLWATLWIASLALWSGGLVGSRRAFVFGALVGATFATSMKSFLLIAALAAARAVAPLAARRAWRAPEPAIVAASIAGFVLVVGSVALGLAAAGALRDFWRLAVVHNVAAEELWSERAVRTVSFFAALPLVFFVARRFARDAGGGDERAATLVLAAGLYAALLLCFWPLVPRQDFLPLAPLCAVLGTAALVRAGDALSRRAAVVAIGATIGIELLLVPSYVRFARSELVSQLAFVGDVLRLTAPSDRVLDLKGEALFRDRAIESVLENITEARIRRGEMQDDVASRMVATRTYVSVGDSKKLPPAARAFLDDNYVSVGRLRVAGRWIRTAHDGSATCRLLVPGRYTLVSARGVVGGTLDGEPFRGVADFGAGVHTLRVAAADEPLALLWATAAENGYSPF
jgi:dolichyl-phosphate-mannose-protein mannosyltransferase